MKIIDFPLFSPIGKTKENHRFSCFEKFKSIVLEAPEELDNFPGRFGMLYTSTLLVPNFIAIPWLEKKTAAKIFHNVSLGPILKSPPSYYPILSRYCNGFFRIGVASPEFRDPVGINYSQVCSTLRFSLSPFIVEKMILSESKFVN